MSHYRSFSNLAKLSLRKFLPALALDGLEPFQIVAVALLGYIERALSFTRHCAIVAKRRGISAARRGAVRVSALL